MNDELKRRAHELADALDQIGVSTPHQAAAPAIQNAIDFLRESALTAQPVAQPDIDPMGRASAGTVNPTQHGWKQAPIEPTGEMWSVGRGWLATYARRYAESTTDAEAQRHLDIGASDIYVQMILAAPQVAAPQGDERPVAGDPVCVDDDGCPTETAVLKRFWRAHQGAQEPVAQDAKLKYAADTLFLRWAEWTRPPGDGNISTEAMHQALYDFANAMMDLGPSRAAQSQEGR